MGSHIVRASVGRRTPGVRPAVGGIQPLGIERCRVGEVEVNRWFRRGFDRRSFLQRGRPIEDNRGGWTVSRPSAASTRNRRPSGVGRTSGAGDLRGQARTGTVAAAPGVKPFCRRGSWPGREHDTVPVGRADRMLFVAGVENSRSGSLTPRQPANALTIRPLTIDCIRRSTKRQSQRRTGRRSTLTLTGYRSTVALRT